jgi:hypothetical protein
MINDIKSAIVYKLRDTFPLITKRYTDDNIPQNFARPSFFVSVIDQDHEKRINTKYKGLLGFDVAYFSDKGMTDIKSDCLAKQEILLREFDLIGTANKFRVLNKNARITDNVLHMTFDVYYSEMKVEPRIPMQTQATNTNL